MNARLDRLADLEVNTRVHCVDVTFRGNQLIDWEVTGQNHRLFVKLG